MSGDITIIIVALCALLMGATCAVCLCLRARSIGGLCGSEADGDYVPLGLRTLPTARPRPPVATAATRARAPPAAAPPRRQQQQQQCVSRVSEEADMRD